MVLVQTIYFTLAVICICTYGTNINQNLLENIGAKYDGKVSVIAYIMQGQFLVILACHIPYAYYSGKESMLIIVDELMRKSISLTLSKKLMLEDENL